MSTLFKSVLAGSMALAIATPATAESWVRFTGTDRTIYLIDNDSLDEVEGIATTRMARVSASRAPGDQSHDVETVLVRCSSGGQVKAETTVSYGPDGTEVDSYTEEMEWEAANPSGVYGAIMSLVCERMRPTGTTYPTLNAFLSAS